MHKISLIFVGITFSLSIYAGKDHAPLSDYRKKPNDYAQHDPTAEQFKDKNFRDRPGGQITLEKTQFFLAKLAAEYRRNLAKDYETRFLENLDIEKMSSIKAEKKSRISPAKSNVLAPYDLYLFPKMHEIIEAVAAQQQDRAEALLDDFVRGYIPYYNPNPFNNIFRSKINMLTLIERMFKSPLKKKNSLSAQANNLRIETEHQISEIQRLLGNSASNLKVGDFLTQDQLTSLLAQSYDISQLNPGESAFWQPISEHEQKQIHEKDVRYFPDENAKKYFNKVLLGGVASPKIQLTFKNADGVERKIKLKVGEEVYAELGSSALLKLIGYNGDSMTYAGDVKFYLGDKSFDNFEAEIRFKFGQTPNPRHTYQRGQDENGERYIIWRDALFEARPEHEIRIAPLDTASWDLQNRREYRAMELAFAWLGINDLKDDSFKALLINKGGEWIPQHRLHDVGFSLGKSFVVKNPNDFLSLVSRKAKVNGFETKIVDKTNTGVIIRWNDFHHQDRKYFSSTYYDYKWMARKIAALKEDDIASALAHSGMHEDMAHLFKVKLFMRRNNIVEAFELQDEYPIFNVPADLSTYSPPQFPSIKNGRINVTAYSGKVGIPTEMATWGSKLGEWLAGKSIPGAHISHEFSDGEIWSASAQVGAITLSREWQKINQDFGPFSKVLLQPGITIIPSRTVIQNSQNFNTNLRDRNGRSILDENGHEIRTNLPYLVIDQLKYVVALKAGIGGIRFLPVSVSGGGSFVERRITHYHFAETVKEGWLSSFRLAKVIRGDVDDFASRELSDLESIDSYYSRGPDVGVKVNAKVIASSLNLGAGAVAYQRKFIYRDQYGRLHRLRDDGKTCHAEASLSLCHQDLLVFDAAALDFGASASRISGRLTDYIVTRGFGLESHDHPDRDEKQREQEFAALRSLDSDQQHPDVQLNFDRIYRGGDNDLHASILFFFTCRTNFNWGRIEDTFSNGQSRKLFQHSKFSGSYLGKKLPLPSLIDAVDVAIKRGKSKQTIVEASELALPEKFSITVKNKEFSRHKNKRELEQFLAKLNARYSKDPKEGSAQLFFSNVILPDEEEQNEYRKIYAVIKVQVDGEYLLEKVRGTSIDDLRATLSRFLDKQSVKIKKMHWSYDADGNYIEKPGDVGKISRIYNGIAAAQKKRKIIADFKALQNLLDNPGQDLHYWRRVWIKSRDLVHNLSSRYYGTHLLKEFLNMNVAEGDSNKGLLVYGEIQNIGDHITTLQRTAGFEANLRNAGNHWGQFQFGPEKARPVQHFLKYEDVTQQLPVYHQHVISSSSLLGFLEKGMAENFSGQGI